MRFNERLAALRSEKSVTQAHIARVICISRAAYSHYETGRSQPDIQIIKKLADFFNVSLEYLLGFTDIRRPAEFTAKVFESPVLGTNKNRSPLLAHYFYTDPISDLPEDDNYFYWQAEEDNMLPMIKPGDLVLIKKENYIRNGDVAAVSFKESIRTRLFTVYKYGVYLLLLSTNSMYEPLIKKSDLVEVLGIVLFRLGPVAALQKE